MPRQSPTHPHANSHLPNALNLTISSFLTPRLHNIDRYQRICAISVPMLSLTPKRILIIDDEPEIREIVQVCLRVIGGWESLQAATGEQGIAQAEAEQPDAILLDVSLPGMNGVDCLQQLQANPKTQSIPVVFLTAHAYLSNPQYYKPLGVTAAIAKPFDPVSLVPTIAHALGWY
jgi:CheY-like chemotaxis protein